MSICMHCALRGLIVPLTTDHPQVYCGVCWFHWTRPSIY